MAIPPSDAVVEIPKKVESMTEAEQLEAILALKEHPKQALHWFKVCINQQPKPKLSVLNAICELIEIFLGNRKLDFLLADELKIVEMLINSHVKVANLIGTRTLEAIIIPNVTSPRSDCSADSDFSEWETDDLAFNPFQRFGWKVQYQSIRCLISLSRSSPKLVLPHLPKILGTHRNDDSLAKFIQSHPSKMVQKASLLFIETIFGDLNAKYFAMASDGKSLSFTSLSQTVSDILSNTNEQMIQYLQSLNESDSVSRLYPVLQVVIRNSPLFKLNKDYVGLWFNVMLKRWENAKCSMDEKCAILNALSELVLQLQFPNHNDLFEKSSLILKNLIETFKTVGGMAIKCFSLQLLRSLTKICPPKIWSDLDSYQCLINDGLASKFPEMNLAYLQFLEQLVSVDLEPKLSVDWWTITLEKVSVFFNNDYKNLRIYSCQIIEHIPPNILDALPKRLVALLKVSMVSFLEDENEMVRASACVAIGQVWIETICIDEIFMQEILVHLGHSLQDSSLKVLFNLILGSIKKCVGSWKYLGRNE